MQRTQDDGPAGDRRPGAGTADAAAFSHPVRVYWEDTDAGGVVFYANYLKFFERARTEWLRTLGFEQQRMKDETGAMFVVVDTRVRFASPARLDDLLDVDVRLVAATPATLALSQRACCGERLLAASDIRIACVSLAGRADGRAGTLRPRRIPTDLLRALGLRRSD